MYGDPFSEDAGPVPGLEDGDAGLSHAGPPPSTLAAQLAENISVSTKSSRSDEYNELKGLLPIIQRVIDNPKLIKTPEERTEHNHMLIYVYSRGILEDTKLDNPFLDRSHVKAEALKAINFLKFSLKETPALLKYEPQDDRFLFRGREPLWVWLLPRLLRLLGHPQCIDLVESIESLFKFFLLLVAETPSLWDIASNIILYLRCTIFGMHSHRMARRLLTASRHCPSPS